MHQVERSSMVNKYNKNKKNLIRTKLNIHTYFKEPEILSIIVHKKQLCT